MRNLRRFLARLLLATHAKSVTVANDPIVWVANCRRHGWLLGMVRPVRPSGVFPAVDKATAKVDECISS